MDKGKLRVIKDYEKLSPELQEQLKLYYDKGFSNHLIKFKNKEGAFISALPFETEDRIYMIRMTIEKAKNLVFKDSDYDDSGTLKSNVRKKYEDEYSDLDYLWDKEDEDDQDDLDFE